MCDLEELLRPEPVEVGEARRIRHMWASEPPWSAWSPIGVSGLLFLLLQAAIATGLEAGAVMFVLVAALFGGVVLLTVCVASGVEGTASLLFVFAYAIVSSTVAAVASPPAETPETGYRVGVALATLVLFGFTALISLPVLLAVQRRRSLPLR